MNTTLRLALVAALCAGSTVCVANISTPTTLAKKIRAHKRAPFTIDFDAPPEQRKPRPKPQPAPQPKPTPAPKQPPQEPTPHPAAELPSSNRPKQYIVLSFDGSRSVQMWKEARALALELNIGITVFMSGVHFLPETLLKKNYDPPGPEYGPGSSSIRKISDAEAGTIPLRLEQIEHAVGEGVEVGSHAVGHFDAGKLGWSTTDWISELSQFQHILLNVFALNSLPERYPGEARTWKQLIGESLKGFRAPLLATNGTLAPALQKMGYRYDGSEAYPMEWGRWPFKKKDADIWEIPMAQIPIAGTAKTQVAMDYNFYAFDSKATPDLKNAAFYSQRWYESLTNYFHHNYYGNRAPIHIGAHFDDYNGRAYFNGFFRFARAVCKKPEVVCVTGSELVRTMQSLGPDRIAEFQKGNFAKLAMPVEIKPAHKIDLKIMWQPLDGGKLLLQAGGKDVPSEKNHFNVQVYADKKLIGKSLGDVKIPTQTGTVQFQVRVYKNGREILSSTRHGDVRAGILTDLETKDRELLLQSGDLPGAHGLPDTSGLLPRARN